MRFLQRQIGPRGSEWPTGLDTVQGAEDTPRPFGRDRDTLLDVFYRSMHGHSLSTRLTAEVAVFRQRAGSRGKRAYAAASGRARTGETPTLQQVAATAGGGGAWTTRPETAAGRQWQRRSTPASRSSPS